MYYNTKYLKKQDIRKYGIYAETERKKTMIKNLSIIFKPEEKSLETLEKVLSLLGDRTWEDIGKKYFLEDESNCIFYFDIEDCYKHGKHGELDKNHKVLTLKEFIAQQTN